MYQWCERRHPGEADRGREEVMWWRSASLIVVGAMLVTTAGCANWAKNWADNRLYADRQGTAGVFYQLHQFDIVDHVTTEAEVREWFGSPWVESTDRLGRKTMIYLFRGKFSPRVDVMVENGVVVSHFVLWGDVGEGESVR